MRRRTFAPLLVAAFAVAVSSSVVVPAVSGGSAAVAATSSERSCEESFPQSTVCGVLTVPETRSDPGSRGIGLDFAVIPASSGAATGTPVAVLARDLGEASTALALAADDGIGGSRDVIVLAERGGPGSSDPFECPAAASAYFDTVTDDVSPAAEATEVSLAMQECEAAFSEDGGNPSSYTRADVVGDLVDLRTVLQIPSWTLYGEGWSGKAMQLAATRDAGGVDALVLDRFSPVDRDVKGDAYLALSDTLAALSARSGGEYPDLNADLAEAAAAFSDEPVHGLVTNPVSGRQRYFSLTGSDVVTIVQAALADPATAAVVPELLQRLVAGETGAIEPFLAQALQFLDESDLPLTWLQSCRTEQPFWSVDPTVPAEEGAEDSEPTPLPVLTYLTTNDQVCGAIGLPAASADDRTVSGVSQPTLLITGSSDPIVSRGATDSGSSAFATHQVLSLAGNGAAGATSDPCALSQLAVWLASPGATIQSECTDQLDRYPVLPASAVHANPRFGSVTAAVDDRNWFELTVPLIFGGFTALWLLGWVVAVIVQAVRRERFGLTLASGIAPVTGALFLGSLWVLVSTAQVVYPAITMIGLPSLAPWIGLALLGVGFFGIIPVWRLGGRATSALAAAATLVWLAAIVWFVWVAVL
ncbi:hypothetical protein N1031_02085 [Herbiconiux moechotypicola]|uniref:Peptidase S33 tripeptidyl aminopeptidase-like C-terminal domain-containing protein n=1 Tax=Herbiconiux moechotypicola TaxID=637393 RepID=A0ABP5Q499_9MICO|nr:hypothetical protein [Herbiconiux moechotypicola]MCS5728540.1 hypothetical protein [Herbiconiux moechotypicola]